MESYSLVAQWKIYGPHFVMLLVQLSFAVMSFMTEASFKVGLNTYVFVSARHLLLAIVLGPVSLFYERTTRPKMTFMLFLEIFVLSLLGVSLGPNMYFASMKHTSPAFVTSMVNTVPSITFVISIILRKEVARVKSLHGALKIAGTVLSLAGATTMSLYKGHGMVTKHKFIHIQENKQMHEDSVRGPVLAIASCISWSAWFILQDYTIKRYPAALSLTTLMCLIGGIQSSIFTIITQKRDEWVIGHGLNLWCVIYSGLVCNGFTFVAQLWCMKIKGAVFVTMFDPIAVVMVVLLSFFIFGETLYTGSIIGAVIVLFGLYMLLWGKNNDKQDESEKVCGSELDEQT